MSTTSHIEKGDRVAFPQRAHLRILRSHQAGSSPSGRQCASRRGCFRVLSRDELAWFCIGALFRACPTNTLWTLTSRGGHPWATRR